LLLLLTITLLMKAESVSNELIQLQDRGFNFRRKCEGLFGV